MKTILLVDDSKTVIAKLQNGIKRNLKDVKILIAYSYKEALEHISQTQKIHLAILDLNLPDAGHGKIVDYAISKNIPSIVLTGFMNEKIKQFILAKEVLEYFNKQDIKSIDQLIQTIERTLKNYDKNILLVDDSNTQIYLAKSILNAMHINVVTANDGEEALKIIKDSDFEFDLVVTDYTMPKMDGMDLTIKIREMYKKDKLGIIVLSAIDQPQTATKFLKIGANDFIHKPYAKVEFMTRINTNLELLDLFAHTRDMANKDFLTGSYNRRFFFESGKVIFDKAVRNNKLLAVAMFDIDKFKNINDTYGHDVGDEAIKEITRLLNEHLRASDLIARFGGEEFCVLLENIELDEASRLFEKIRLAFEKNILKVGDLEIKFTVSIGVCYGIELTLEDMIKKSDEGLYYCKENGRNQVYMQQSFLGTA